jgi:hypothetical protein
MNHAITWGALFGVGFIVAGLGCLAAGALAFFGGMMSDAPEEGDSTGRLGCLIAVVGVALLALGIWSVL